MIHLRRTLVSFVLVFLVVGPVGALVPRQGGRDPREIDPPRLSRSREVLDVGETSAAGAAARAFVAERGGTWDFAVDRRVGRPGLVQGSGIPIVPGRGNSLDASVLSGLPLGDDGRVTIDTLVPLGREFIAAHPGLLRPSAGDLVLDRVGSLVRDGGRLATLRFQWTVNDIEVEGAEVFLRFNSGNLTQFGAPLIGEIDSSSRPALDADEAARVLMKYTGDDETYRLHGDPELIFQPEDRVDGGVHYRLVWKVTYRLFEQIETWEGRIDAQTGEVVGFRDTNHYARAVGGVYPRTVFDQNETTVPFPQADVVVGASTITADTSGFYTYGGETLSSGLDGRWFNTSCQGCLNPSQPTVAPTMGTGRVDFGLGGQDQFGNGFSTPADRNAHFHLTQLRRIAKGWLPSLTWLDGTITALVNINNSCNAVYNGNVNFYRAGGDCNNTGEISDVMHHEYGHGLDGNTNGGDGATGEATADLVAMHMSHSPLIGPGFRVTGAPVRNLDQFTSSRGLLSVANIDSKCPQIGTPGPLGYEVHCEGEIYGQVHWDLSQAMAARHGHNTGWRDLERIFFTSLPDNDGYLSTEAQSAYDAYINADDDDGNLANGTPNAQTIFNAFDGHGIAGTLQATSPHCARPQQPVVTVTPDCDSFQVDWTDVAGIDHYQVLRGEIREDQALFPLATIPAGTTTFADTEVAPAVDYWYVVMAVDPAGCESTIENLEPARLTAQPILSVTAAISDDTPRGNRSGFADPGEEVDLFLTLSNFGEIDAETVSGSIVTTTPGVTILGDTSTWPTVPRNGGAANEGVLRFMADDQVVGCGDLVKFQFVPSEASGCAAETSYFEVRMGESDGQGGFNCDDTPACFIEPNFAGLDTAVGGTSCAETILSWGDGTSNCVDATISYNVYRSTDPGFVPGPANLVAQGLVGNGFDDSLLVPGETYHYVVRAFDSRSGEESNVAIKSVVSPTTPDLRAPLFSGLDVGSSGAGCGETSLSWAGALETCNGPASYEIYRSTDPGFAPDASTLIGSTLDVSFVDAALMPGVEYTYVVRARDGAGNEEANAVSLTVLATALDDIKVETPFELSDAAWSVVAPDDAETGSWEWGDPAATSYQSGDDATEDGVNAWITGLSGTPSNGDIDNGTTTLRTAAYNLNGTVDPVVRYSRYFTNERGASPNDASDHFLIDISNDDGTTWTPLENIECNPACPLDWVDVEIPITVPVSPKMRFRFQAADLGDGSLVEAGIDDFSLADRGQGCAGCAPEVNRVGEILLDRNGDDVVIDWQGDPVVGSRFNVYRQGNSGDLNGMSGEPTAPGVLSIGSTDTRKFVHGGAAPTAGLTFYRVTAIDECGNESELGDPFPIP